MAGSAIRPGSSAVSGRPILFRAIAVLALLSTALPGILEAQEARGSGSPCSYDGCALRVEPGGFLSPRTVVRGRSATPIASFDPSPVLEQLFAPVDSAAAHYRIFARSDTRADWLGRAGILLTIGGVGLTILDRDRYEGWTLGLELTGVALELVGMVPRRSARRSLSRAVWWYNRSLVRRGGPPGS